MLTVLRSLALLDEAYTIKSASLNIIIRWPKTDFSNQGERPQTMTALPSLKRKVGYGDKEVNADDKRNKMVIDAA